MYGVSKMQQTQLLLQYYLLQNLTVTLHWYVYNMLSQLEIHSKPVYTHYKLSIFYKSIYNKVFVNQPYVRSTRVVLWAHFVSQ